MVYVDRKEADEQMVWVIDFVLQAVQEEEAADRKKRSIPVKLSLLDSEDEENALDDLEDDDNDPDWQAGLTPGVSTNSWPKQIKKVCVHLSTDITNKHYKHIIITTKVLRSCNTVALQKQSEWAFPYVVCHVNLTLNV